MNEAKEFGHWLIRHTREVVNTMGACRIYKNRTMNLHELYDAWQEFKTETEK